MGVHIYIFFGTTAPGALLAGLLTQIGGTTLAFAVAGAVDLLVVGVGLLWHLRWRRRAEARVRPADAPVDAIV